MNNELWNKILDFKIDNPNDAYGFVTRLATENSWTLSYTESAILEYKKFMYLAASYNEMDSPSEIVDIVWHQHLIFTVSYDEFCKLLSKKIEHIPSTHNKDEKETFAKAKNKTKELYETNFGLQPEELWKFSNDLESLKLKPSKINSKYNNLIFIISLAVISNVAYYLLKPVLIRIESSDFLLYYPLLCILSFALLDFFIKRKFERLLNKIQSNTIIKNLTPFELIYLQKKHLAYVVHGVVNNLLADKKIKITEDAKLTVLDERLSNNQYSNAILKIMNEYEVIPYALLIKIAIKNPIFEQIKKSGDKTQNHISSSQEIQPAILFTGIYLVTLFSIGLSRLILGISRGKPVIYISIIMVLLVLFSIYFLKQVATYLFRKSIPNFYKK